MIQVCNLSYILATRNRLPFLKIVLEKLIQNLLSDEEIVVIDGDSSDGTTAYLEQLNQQNKIEQYVSQPDYNQAHAWNKGFLLANGKLIKKIMDDDVFDINAIRKCKDWMLDNPDTDICISNALETQLENPDQITTASRLQHFLNWKLQKTNCFSFCDVHMLIRKSALSFTGLYDTQFTMIDWEFALRCSFLNAKIIYYTGFNAFAVQTPGNISSLSVKKALKKEAQIAKIKYNYPGDRSEITLWSEIKIYLGNQRNRLLKNASFNKIKKIYAIPEETELKIIYANFYKILDQKNTQGIFKFIC